MTEYQSLRDHDGNDEEHEVQQSGDWRENMSQFGKKLGASMSMVGGRLSEQVNVVKDLFHAPTLAERLVDEATSDVLIGADWEKNLQICDLINGRKISGVEVVRGIKKRLSIKNGHIQLLSLSCLETVLKNCGNMFSDVASEKVLEVMVRIVDDPTSPSALREKSLKLIEAWGEATDELRYLPVFEETYKSLKNRGIVFPPRDAESLAPIFTPAQSVPTPPPPAAAPAPAPAYPSHGAAAPWAAAAGADAAGGGYQGRAPGGGYQGSGAPGVANGVLAFGEPGVRAVDTPQGRVVVLDSKEILGVARNTVELLSTVLTSAPPNEVVKDEVTLSLAAQCRTSKRSVMQLVENETNNESLLFEALTVNDELDKALEKLAQLQKEVGPTQQQPTALAADTNAPLVNLLAPPQALPTQAETEGVPPSVTSFAVPSGEHEADGGEPLVRKRVGSGYEAAGVPGEGVPGAGGHANDDDRALAELDAMVFGKSTAPPAASQSCAAGGEQQQEGDKKRKEDDLIFF